MVGFIKIQTDERLEEICHLTNQQIKAATKEYEENFHERSTQHLTKVQKNLTTNHEIKSSKLKIEQKLKVLNSQHALIEQVKDEAAKKFDQSDESVRVEILLKFIQQSLKSFDDSQNNFCIRTLKKDLQLVQKIVEKLNREGQLKILVVDNDFLDDIEICGVMISKPDLSIQVKNSVKLRLEQIFEFGGSEFQKMLFFE